MTPARAAVPGPATRSASIAPVPPCSRRSMPRPAADQQPGHGQRPDRVGDGEGDRGGERGRGHGHETSRAGRRRGGPEWRSPVPLSAASPDFPSWPRPFDPDAELDWSDPAFSRRLLAEHLDQSHDGASRRLPLVERHVRRLVQLLPGPPARVLDAGCGPGLYAIRLARLGYRVDGIDVGPAVIRHARRAARAAGVSRARPTSRWPTSGRCRSRPATRRPSSSTTSSRT